MPRHRKPTPARPRRAVSADAPARKRKPASTATAASAPEVSHEAAQDIALAVSATTEPVAVAEAPRRTAADAFQQALEIRDTRPFRERVASRRGTVGLLLFRLGSETFAAELGAVEEAVEVPALHGLPEMQTGMLGMFDLRGKLLPVFSATNVLGVPLTPGSTAALIVHGGERRIAVAVDDVDDVIDADCAQLRNLPGGADSDGVLLAILQRGTALASLIDASALVEACLASSPDHA